MFEKKEAPNPVAPDVTSPTLDDVIVHVMPREFYGREVTALPTPTVQPPPAPPSPVPVPPPVQMAPVPAAPQMPRPLPPPERSSKFPVLILLFIMLLFTVGAAVAGYYYLLLPSVAPEDVTPPAEVEEVPVEEPEEVPVEEPIKPQPGTDTDSDGLTNVEELLYGTDYRDPDTDKDTFLDGNEVFHRYHPNGSAPLTLLDTGAVRIFENAEMPFTLYYPATWTPVVSRTEGTSVTYRSPTTAAITVTAVPKDFGEELETWYEGYVRDSFADDLEATYTKEGLYSLSMRDDRVAYLDGGSETYIFQYDLGDEATIEFLQTFQMMVNSFTILP